MSYSVFWGIFMRHERRMRVTFIALLENTMNHEWNCLKKITFNNTC